MPKQCLKFIPDKESLSGIYGKHEIFGFMNPSDFLSLGSKIDFKAENQYRNPKNKLTSVEWHTHQLQTHHPIDVPMLFIDETTGEITGHEGRHRSKASIDLGINQIPVVIRMNKYVPFTDEYGFIDYTTLNALTSSTKSINQMVQDIGNKQKTSLMPLPSICHKEGHDMICEVKPEVWQEENKNPKTRVRIQITDFDPICEKT